MKGRRNLGVAGIEDLEIHILSQNYFPGYFVMRHSSRKLIKSLAS
jgi:hypothetical protein